MQEEEKIANYKQKGKDRKIKFLNSQLGNKQKGKAVIRLT
jgi:hypothetical protein